MPAFIFAVVALAFLFAMPAFIFVAMVSSTGFLLYYEISEVFVNLHTLHIFDIIFCCPFVIFIPIFNDISQPFGKSCKIKLVRCSIIPTNELR